MGDFFFLLLFDPLIYLSYFLHSFFFLVPSVFGQENPTTLRALARKSLSPRSILQCIFSLFSLSLSRSLTTLLSWSPSKLKRVFREQKLTMMFFVLSFFALWLRQCENFSYGLPNPPMFLYYLFVWARAFSLFD